MIATDIRAKWKSDILRLIQRRPGIDGSTLCKRLQYIPIDTREQLISELIAEGQIRPEKAKPIRGIGRPKVCYWPLASITQQKAPGSIQVTIRYPGHLEPPPSTEEQLGMLGQIQMSDADKVDWRALNEIIKAAYH